MDLVILKLEMSFIGFSILFLNLIRNFCLSKLFWYLKSRLDFNDHYRDQLDKLRQYGKKDNI